ncbi:MAG: IPTL-CTERM sorting domain-containing protein [Dokdonella sp.]
MSLLRDPYAPRQLAIALAIATTLAAQAQGNASSDTSWIRFRADPVNRVFADMAQTRSRPLPTARAAATWPVTNCADVGTGTLRDAVGNAASGDTIDLTALTCATITLQTGAIPVNLDDLTIVGPGRNALTLDGNDADRIFFHPGQGQLRLEAMTIQRGRDRATGFHVAGGGCIASAGYLVLDGATVRNCYAGGEGAYGGAIYAYSLTMANSTLSGNLGYGVHEDAGTAAFGGAAFVYTMDLVDSTVTGNRAEHLFNPGRTTYDIGGGIITVRGGSIANSTIDSNTSYGRGGGIAAFNPITISNSTFSGNIAQTDVAGALFLRWPATLEANNCTITANYAQGGGGGIWLATSNSRLQSTLLFGNSAGASHFADVEGRQALTIAGSHNLIGSSDLAVTLPADTLVANPLLGPLTYNGGPTRTHALLAGSPAVNAGVNPANLPFDQRGSPFARVHGAAPDIGAYEQQALPAPFASTPVPTLSHWMLAMLASLLCVFSLRARNHSRR